MDNGYRPMRAKPGYISLQDFVVSLADFTIHPDYSADIIRQKTVVNDIGECEGQDSWA